MKRLLSSCAAVAVGLAFGATSDLPQRDSSAFDFKYEMETPLVLENLDGDNFVDFTTNGYPSASSHYGVIDCTFGKNAYYASMDGYTIELRMKLNYMSTGASYALALSASDGSGCDMCLNFQPDKLTWYGTLITNFVTTGSFHTYRIAKIPREPRFALWCDGVLVKDNLGDAFPANADLNRLLLGAIGGAYGGGAYFCYMRFTKGAYAPKVLAQDSSEFAHKYEMDSADTRFSPTATASDWTLGSGETGEAVLSDGVFSVEQPFKKMRYYATKESMDPSVTASSPFTFEIKARVHDAWQDTAGRVLNIYCGTPRFSANFFVATNSVVWSSAYIVIHQGDNTDKMHVFRVTYDGDRQDGFTLWRDGEKIAENLSGAGAYNQARFGIVSTSSHGGSFDVDYVRWTTDGVFAPYIPPMSTLMIFR